MTATARALFGALCATALGVVAATAQSAPPTSLARVDRLVVGLAEGSESTQVETVQERVHAALAQLERLGVGGMIEVVPGGDRLIVSIITDAETDPSSESFDPGIMGRCPDATTPEQLRRDGGLRTVCLAERLRASRRFDYVEYDMILGPD